MSKSPEEYFQQQQFIPESVRGGVSFTEAELAFMRKYMGLERDATLSKIGINIALSPSASTAVAAAIPPAESLVDLVEQAAPLAEQAVAESAQVTASMASAGRSAPVALELEAAEQPAAVSAAHEAHLESAGQSAAVFVDHGDLEAFKETVRQQFVSIQAALAGLKADGGDSLLPDALYRSLSTLQNSAGYIGLDEIKVYARRTAEIVDQARKSKVDFSVLLSLLEQECSIIEDMIADGLCRFETAAEALAPVEPIPAGPAVGAEPLLAIAPIASAAEAVAPVPSVPVASTEPPSAVVPTASEAEAVAPVAVIPAGPFVAEATTMESALENSLPRDLPNELPVEEDLDLLLRKESELLLVGFYLGRQEFTVPTLAVQEVILYEPPTKMPSSPEFVAGVINLRGKITPLVFLRDMLEIKQERQTEDRFIIVCRRKGLQLGLIIERVHTMYRVLQTDIDWGIEAHLGINVDFVSGLLKLNENLVGIVSIDRIIERVLG